MQTKVTVEKTPRRAGATPLFRLSAAQKVSVGSLPPRHADRVPCLIRACDRTTRGVLHLINRVCGEENMWQL
jgi:hypothetical protein